jgi:hypothetical protein
MRLKILNASIQEGYVGHCQLDGKKYSLNIQNQSGSKIVKFPFECERNDVVIKLTGKNLLVRDDLKFKGFSKWIEIYSDIITNYLVNNQDGLDGLEMYID